jgi:two-component system OmpR family response regulator
VWWLGRTSVTTWYRFCGPESNGIFDMRPQPVSNCDAASRHHSGLNIHKALPPHILIVDDDPQIRDALQAYLSSNGLRVSVASSGTEMKGVLVDHSIDLVLLDRRLADEDGMVLARKLRNESVIPIIILTGVHDEADRIMGLELGADDYLTKPFSPRELLARVRTVLRRTRREALPETKRGDVRAYRFASFELNLRTRRLANTEPGRRIDLSNGEFNLLAALVADPQRVLTRDELLAASRVYDNEVYDRSVDIQVFRLRRKIEVNPSEPQFILTERSVGYSFNSPVEVIY